MYSRQDRPLMPLWTTPVFFSLSAVCWFMKALIRRRRSKPLLWGNRDDINRLQSLDFELKAAEGRPHF